MENLIDHGSVESGRYHLARRTLYEMLHDRGYAVATSDINMNLADFRANFGDKPDPTSLQFSASLLSDTSKQILVMFCGEDTIKSSTITAISSHIEKDTWSSLILVVQNNLTAKARQAVKENFPFKVEIFQITELLVNFTRHNLMPKHEILTAEEKKEFMKKYSVVDKQIPRMLETDAIARYYGFEKGNVIKATYDGEHTGHFVYYRCVM